MFMNTIKALSVPCGYLLFSSIAFPSGQPVTLGQDQNRWETRCGWFSNPTPANAWFEDKDGEWTISIQGGHQAEGDWPAFKPRQWVVTNTGGYGYGCACLRVRVDKEKRIILEIKSSHARPLTACRKDRSLKEPKQVD
jgi:hypothetical protein